MSCYMQLFKTKALSAPVPSLLAVQLMKLHGYDNWGGINVKTCTKVVKAHLLTSSIFYSCLWVGTGVGHCMSISVSACDLMSVYMCVCVWKIIRWGSYIERHHTKLWHNSDWNDGCRITQNCQIFVCFCFLNFQKMECQFWISKKEEKVSGPQTAQLLDSATLNHPQTWNDEG